MHPITKHPYEAIETIQGRSVGLSVVAKFLRLKNQQTAKNWEDRGPSNEGLVTAVNRSINTLWFTDGRGRMLTNSVVRAKVVPVANCLNALIDAIATRVAPVRKEFAEDWAVLALAPDSVRIRAKVLAAFKGIHASPGTESQSFHPAVPQIKKTAT